MSKQDERFSLRISPEVMEEARDGMAISGARSMNTYIETAIRFYNSYVRAEDRSGFLPHLILSGLQSIVAESDNLQSRMTFKIAVELSMINRILAAYNRISDEDFLLLRQACLDDVRSLNGAVTLEVARDELKDEA